MKPKSFRSALFVFLMLSLLMSACGLSATPTATATLLPTHTSTPTFTPTATSTPTQTPLPTVTPNVAATEYADRSEQMRAEVQKYVDAGYLSSANGGVYDELPDFEQDWAQIGWYRWWASDINVGKVFVLSTHFKWSSAIKNPDPSGCGIAFGISADGVPQILFIDRTSVLFLDANGSSYGRVKGNGRLSLPTSPEIDVTIVVNNKKQTLLIDDEFIAEFAYENLSGWLGYSVLSGTNKDYGTHCEITNSRLWKIR